MSDVTIRPAVEADLEAIHEIYNGYIRDTPITFDIDPIPMERRREWFTHYQTHGRHRLWVAVRDGACIGYATSSPFRPKAAYDTSVETTIYLAPGAGGGGIGSQLYGALFESLDGEDVHRAYAGITLPNDASVAIHRRFGFEQVGLYREVGRKFERYWDVGWFEKKLD